jgi:hypothetical protein
MGFAGRYQELRITLSHGGQSAKRRETAMLEDHFGSGSTLQRNERVKLAASFWNNVGAGMVIGGMAAAFFLDKPSGTWTKIGMRQPDLCLAGFVILSPATC